MNEPIIATKDRPGSYDAIESAKPGEGLFPLQGGDPFSPPTILHWVKLVRAAAFEEADPKKAEKMLRKATDAEQVAWAFMDYQKGLPSDAPLPERPAPVYYSGHTIEISEDQDQRRRVREAMIKAAGRLQNLIAIGTEIFELLAELQQHPEEEVQLREAIATIREVAFKLEPRRGNERS